MCINIDEDRVSTLRITPSWMARFWSLFRGVTYRVVIAHRGSVDKIVLYLNDDQIYSLVPHSTRPKLPWESND